MSSYHTNKALEFMSLSPPLGRIESGQQSGELLGVEASSEKVSKDFSPPPRLQAASELQTRKIMFLLFSVIGLLCIGLVLDFYLLTTGFTPRTAEITFVGPEANIKFGADITSTSVFNTIAIDSGSCLFQRNEAVNVQAVAAPKLVASFTLSSGFAIGTLQEASMNPSSVRKEMMVAMRDVNFKYLKETITDMLQLSSGTAAVDLNCKLNVNVNALGFFSVKMQDINYKKSFHLSSADVGTVNTGKNPADTNSQSVKSKVELLRSFFNGEKVFSAINQFTSNTNVNFEHSFDIDTTIDFYKQIPTMERLAIDIPASTYYAGAPEAAEKWAITTTAFLIDLADKNGAQLKSAVTVGCFVQNSATSVDTCKISAPLNQIKQSALATNEVTVQADASSNPSFVERLVGTQFDFSVSLSDLHSDSLTNVAPDGRSLRRPSLDADLPSVPDKSEVDLPDLDPPDSIPSMEETVGKALKIALGSMFRASAFSRMENSKNCYSGEGYYISPARRKMDGSFSIASNTTSNEDWNATNATYNEYWYRSNTTYNEYWNATNATSNEYWNRSNITSNEYWNATNTTYNEYWNATGSNVYQSCYSTGSGSILMDFSFVGIDSSFIIRYSYEEQNDWDSFEGRMNSQLELFGMEIFQSETVFHKTEFDNTLYSVNEMSLLDGEEEYNNMDIEDPETVLQDKIQTVRNKIDITTGTRDDGKQCLTVTKQDPKSEFASFCYDIEGGNAEIAITDPDTQETLLSVIIDSWGNGMSNAEVAAYSDNQYLQGSMTLEYGFHEHGYHFHSDITGPSDEKLIDVTSKASWNFDSKTNWIVLAPEFYLGLNDKTVINAQVDSIQFRVASFDDIGIGYWGASLNLFDEQVSLYFITNSHSNCIVIVFIGTTFFYGCCC